MMNFILTSDLFSIMHIAVFLIFLKFQKEQFTKLEKPVVNQSWYNAGPSNIYEESANNTGLATNELYSMPNIRTHNMRISKMVRDGMPSKT